VQQLVSCQTSSADYNERRTLTVIKASTRGACLGDFSHYPTPYSCIFTLTLKAPLKAPLLVVIDKMSKHLFVGNLPFSVGWQELKDLFKDAGTVERADIALNGGRSKGFGTVCFQSEQDAAKAIEMFNDFEFYGRKLQVREDLAVKERPESDNNQQKIKNILFVGNLPYSIQWQDLKDMFREAGNVVRADISKDASWRHKGYGQVVMGSEEETAKAIELFDGKEIEGRKIEVREDKFGSVETSTDGGVQIFVGNVILIM
jgi:RNA recognition motif-containing protein